MAKKKDEREPRLVVRPMRMDDYPAVAELQRRCFPDMQPWTEAMFESQLAVFPEGQIGVELDGLLVACSSSLIVDTDDLDEQHSFEQACDHGFLGNHDPDGDALYGIDIAVDPNARGKRIARRLYDARKQLCRDRRLRRFIIAGRMPRYHKHHGTLTPEAYVASVLAKQHRDPVITTQLANGFAVRAVLRDYLPSDRESMGHAVLMEWLNPDHVPLGRRRRGGAGKVRVAAVQYQMRPVRAWEEFAQQCEFFIDTAGEYRADFVLFPELLTNQLLALVPETRPGLSARRLDEFTERYLAFFSKMAIDYNVNIIGGSHLVVESDRLYNIAFLFHRDGRIDRQYKLHITPAEARWWGVSPGDRLNVFETDRGRIAILICYDAEFPELARIAAARGAQVLFIPYNTDLRQGHLRVRYCAHARCIENHVYAVLAGAVGNLPQVEGADIHYAQACILTPSDISFARDAIEAEATPNTEAMLIHDIDLDVLRRTRRTGTVRTWLDRRKDLYAVHYRDPDGEEIV
jgi:predicted amidohydrolase/ribosomal protein S18 acetylase RimI-like enzyme